MARMMGNPLEFQADGRKVVLLTLKEAVALYNAIRYLEADDSKDLQRARNVLFNQIEWLSHPTAQGHHH